MEHADQPVTIRVMVFNIEEGGEGIDLGMVVDAIRLAEPDIVALEEAMGNTDRIATRLGWEYASARTQVLSRHPILDRPEGDTEPVFVEVRPARMVALANVHLPAEPYGPELVRTGGSPEAVIELERRIRLSRLERLLAPLPGLAAAGIPVFLAGDFNAPSHLDWTAAAVGTRPHVRGVVDWPVSRAIEAAGFRDAWREIHPDPVREPGLTWWVCRPPTGGYDPGPGTPDDRIDMVYAAGPSVTTDCRIVGEPGGQDVAVSVDPWPSDHRAVVATFRTFPATTLLPAGAIVSRTNAAPRQPMGLVQVATSTVTYRVGEPIEVTWSGGPAYRWDWIAIFRAPAHEIADAYLLWGHTGARASGTARLDGRSAEADQSSAGGRWPLPPGDYEAAYLLDDSTLILGRTAFEVIP